MDEETALKIATEVASIYPKSFANFSTWRKSQQKENPIPAKRRPELRMQVREMLHHGYVTNDRNCFLSRVIKQVYDNLFRKEIEPRFSGLKNKHVLLENVLSLDEYFRKVDLSVRDILCILGSEFLDEFDINVTEYTKRKFYSTFIMRLRDCCFSIMDDVRNSHSYNSVWVCRGIAMMDCNFYTEQIVSYFTEEEALEYWERPYRNLMRESIRRQFTSLPDDISERDFAAYAGSCIHMEMTYASETFLPYFPGIKAAVCDILRETYYERVEQKKFRSPIALLTLPEEQFEPVIIEDIAFFHGDASAGNELVDVHLKREVESKVYEWVTTADNVDKFLQFAERGETLKKDRPTFTELLQAFDILKSRLHSALYDCERRVYEKALELFEKPNGFATISDQGIIKKIRRTGHLFARALCGLHAAEKNITDEMELLHHFFFFMADQRNFMDEIRSVLLRQINSGNLGNLSNLRAFLQSDKIISFIPGSLSHMMRDIEHSAAFRSSFQNLPIGTNSSLLGSRTVVLRERDERKDYEDLLARPEEVSATHNGFANLIKNGLHSKENLKTLNCFSFVTIRTSLFSGNRGSVRIRLMVYQYSVLKLLQDGDQFLVRDVYKSLIRPDIKDEATVKVAKELVNKVLSSLMRPHPLISVSSSRAKISALDPIMLNSDFVCDKDMLLIEPVILLAQTPKVQVREPKARSERSKFKIGVAKMMIRSRLSQGPVKEQELFEDVVEKARKNTVQEEDVQDAFQLMLQKSLIKRVGENNEYVKYLSESEEES